MGELVAQIPQTIKDIDVVWLRTVLGHDTSTVCISDICVEPLSEGPGVVGQLARININFQRNEKKLPNSMIAKLSSANDELRKTCHAARYYEKEVKFYSELSGFSGEILARCFYGDIDMETGYHVLLLDDLSELTKLDMQQGCSVDNAKLVIGTLAALHQRWWQHPQLFESDFVTPFDYMADYWQKQFLIWWQTFLQKVEKHFPDIPVPQWFLSVGSHFGRNLPNVYMRLRQSPVTLIHRDTHTDNFLIDYENNSKVVLLDWQSFGLGRAATDIACFMITSVKSEIRTSAETDLLNYYHGHLMANGISDYSYAELISDYKLAFFRNLFILAVVLAKADLTSKYNKKLIRTILPRLISFAEDHDVLAEI